MTTGSSGLRARQPGFKGWVKQFEVVPPKGQAYATDQWINHDLAPMDTTRRTWGGWSYVVYWATGGFAIYNYSTGSALIAYGLSAKQCLLWGLFSPVILAALCILCGWPGGSHHVSYTVASRTAWGMRGSWFAVFFRVMPALIWDAIEAFWGGQAVATMIGSLSLSWASWDYPLAGGSLQAKDLIGFFLFYIVYLIVMWLPPEKLHRPFLASCVMFTIVIIGLLAWSLSAAKGAGKYFAADYQPPNVLAGSIGWAIVYGATSVLGNCGCVTLGQADWCRFSRSGNRVPMLVQAVACPVFIYAAFALGIVVTSASADVLGDAYWQPYLLLRTLQAHYRNSAGSRAAVFFASAACVFAQVNVNIILNSVAAAMDMASYSPRWLTIRRGAYLIAAVGLALNPWYLTASAQTFIAVLAGFGVFYGPLSGIMVADFWILRRRLVVMRDLYVGDGSSMYWFTAGFNLRAFAAFVVAIVPALPGYIMGCVDLNTPPNAWVKLSRLGFITGFILAAVVYCGLSFAFPPAGLGQGEDHHDEYTLILPTAYDQTRPTQVRHWDGERAAHPSQTARASDDRSSDLPGAERKVEVVEVVGEKAVGFR